VPFKVADVFVGKVERLGELVRTGQMDSILVRPLGTLGQTLTSDTDLKQVGGVVQGAAVFALALARADVTWTPGRLLMLAAMLASGFVIFCSVWIGTNSAAFWLVNVREATNAFTYGGNFLTQYPLDIFGAWFRRLFAFVIPIAFVNYFPSLYILGKSSEPWPSFLRFASPLVALVSAIAATLIWRAGVRRYTSTGS
jgi:ABC-2 type transport system permease protein